MRSVKLAPGSASRRSRWRSDFLAFRRGDDANLARFGGTIGPKDRASRGGMEPATPADMKTSRPFVLASTATIGVVVLAAAASLAGLLLPGLYAEDALEAAMRGQDLATLIALPFLIIALRRMKGGSPRATVVWIGLLGYLLYT